MYGYDKDEFTDAYDSFVYLFHGLGFYTLPEYVEFLVWLPEADHNLIGACVQEYMAEFMTH